MTNKPKHKIWHEFNFYFSVGSFVGGIFHTRRYITNYSRNKYSCKFRGCTGAM